MDMTTNPPDSTPLLMARSASADDALLVVPFPKLHQVPPRADRTGNPQPDQPPPNVTSRHDAHRAQRRRALEAQLHRALEAQLRGTIRDAIAQQLPTVQHKVAEELHGFITTRLAQERLRSARQQRSGRSVALAALVIALAVAAWVAVGSAGY